MANFLILHGTDGTPESNWFMWLKGVLTGQGHKVWLPQLPNSDKPNIKTYNEFLLKNPDFVYDENTLIIGHSSGSVEALSLLQHLPENTKIKAAILVSAFKDNLGWDSLVGLFIEPFDFDIIKAHCEKFTFIHSDNDPYCPIEHAEYLVKQTNGKLIKFEGQGHFNTELGPQYNKFPEILKIINNEV
jgi:predicted alpha/beta hydrolase family esterase